MNKSKFIVIEGTDSSGKETQSRKLVERLNNENIKTVYLTFPMYDTPTGKIIGGPYLGKEHICDGWFKEMASNVDPLVASLYYAADRRYNFHIIKEHLDNGCNVICDRYIDSNMAHQAGRELNKEKRLKIYDKLQTLEYEILELQKPDFTIFLHLPWEYSKKALELREEKPDQLELSQENLKNSERAYLEIAKLHNYYTIECLKEEQRKNVDELHEEVYSLVKTLIKK